MFFLNANKYPKYTVFGISLVLLSTAIGLLINGFNVCDIFSEYETFLIPEFNWFPISQMFIGSIIIVLSFCACWAALKESYCTILTFFILLALSSLLALTVGIFSYLLRPHIQHLIKYPMTSALERYDPNRVNDETMMWDYVQKSFACCGVFNSSDWQYVSKDVLPLSCCSLPNGYMGNFSCTYDLENVNRYVSGCLDFFSEYIEAQFTSLGNAGIATAVVVWTGIILAIFYARTFKNPYIPANDAERIYYLSK